MFEQLKVPQNLQLDVKLCEDSSSVSSNQTSVQVSKDSVILVNR